MDQMNEIDKVATIILPERFQDEKAAVAQQMIEEKIEQGCRMLVLDFSAMIYIDSSGLSVLLAVNKQVHACGGRMVLTGLNEEVRNFFAVTYLDQIFVIE
ncbi:MAG: STAS domain-containing protein [Negativicutes bacterium]|nr:STAS domain-containing protein [Negativicutes bacterium]